MNGSLVLNLSLHQASNSSSTRSSSGVCLLDAVPGMVVPMADVEGNEVVRPGEGPFTHPSQLWLVADQDLLALSADLGTRPPGSEAEIWNPLHPLVVGVSSAKSIQRLRNILDRRDVKAVIAWRLPEEYLGSLYNLGLPILIGRPSPQDLLSAVNVGVNSDAAAAARAHAAELATLEAVFDQPAGSEANRSEVIDAGVGTGSDQN